MVFSQGDIGTYSPRSVLLICAFSTAMVYGKGIRSKSKQPLRWPPQLATGVIWTRLLCGSINVRERPWASKRQPIDYKRCCTDRLNAHPESRHSIGAANTSPSSLANAIQHTLKASRTAPPEASGDPGDYPISTHDRLLLVRDLPIAEFEQLIDGATNDHARKRIR